MKNKNTKKSLLLCALVVSSGGGGTGTKVLPLAARRDPEPASTSPFDQLDPLRTQPTSGLNLWDHSSSSQNKGDLASVVRQIENLNRYVTALEGKLVTRIEVCEGDVTMAGTQAVELATQYMRCQEISRRLYNRCIS